MLVHKPTVVEKEDGSTVETHPAYAQARISRQSGRAYLYGSDFSHQHYMVLSVHSSELHRHLNSDWPHAGNTLFEVAFSEAGWAQFVSSVNQGAGVQCTLIEANGEQIPSIPRPRPRADQFKQEIADDIKKMSKELADLAAQLSVPLSKTKAQEIQHKMKVLSDNMLGNMSFVAARFEEHIEDVVQAAKAEIFGHASTVQQLDAPVLKTLELK